MIGSLKNFFLGADNVIDLGGQKPQLREATWGDRLRRLWVFSPSKEVFFVSTSGLGRLQEHCNKVFGAANLENARALLEIKDCIQGVKSIKVSGGVHDKAIYVWSSVWDSFGKKDCSVDDCIDIADMVLRKYPLRGFGVNKAQGLLKAAKEVKVRLPEQAKAIAQGMYKKFIYGESSAYFDPRHIISKISDEGLLVKLLEDSLFLESTLMNRIKSLDSWNSIELAGKVQKLFVAANEALPKSIENRLVEDMVQRLSQAFDEEDMEAQRELVQSLGRTTRNPLSEPLGERYKGPLKWLIKGVFDELFFEDVYPAVTVRELIEGFKRLDDGKEGFYPELMGEILREWVSKDNFSEKVVRLEKLAELRDVVQLEEVNEFIKDEWRTIVRDHGKDLVRHLKGVLQGKGWEEVHKVLEQVGGAYYQEVDQFWKDLSENELAFRKVYGKALEGIIAVRGDRDLLGEQTKNNKAIARLTSSE